ncbi:uncharacterized protein N7473_000263 [Penicillium subrubescens]|uniref:uncharacterized protein n=1 Tax=Penicillium subrubescens TaxID=1316194 RepID=UPI00254501E3|nr:uncharacterized protein N7473_000263 [Penicillium subrubescens]KAJ5910960.1 hypothetical protein N7473_000263 [Penicillium subrubescens]
MKKVKRRTKSGSEDDSEDLPGCGWCPGPRQLTVVSAPSKRRKGKRGEGRNEMEMDGMDENGRDAPVGGVDDESWGEEERKIGSGGRREEEKEKDCWWWWLIVGEVE